MEKIHNRWISLLVVAGILLMLTTNCKKKEDTNNSVPHANAPGLTIDSVSSVTGTSAVVMADITSQGSSAVILYGLCWSTSENPTNADSHTASTPDTSITELFSTTLSGLDTNTRYFVRAYATNSAGTGYSAQVSFTTLPGVMETIISIDSLKNWYNAYHLTDTLKITPDFIVEGVVSANDESGNIYKNLYFQDNTGGIKISLDLTNLYEYYHVGQKVRIRCKDLYLGLYGTAIQIGYPNNGTIGRIPVSMISSHVLIEGLPGFPPQPVVINIGHLPDLNNLTSLLVAINSVTFPEAGQPFVEGSNPTSRAVADSAGNVSSLVVYTSQYANFRYVLLPAGAGTLQGILTVYNGTFEILVRDTNDLINFHVVKKFH
jgi:hypothetical protein